MSKTKIFRDQHDDLSVASEISAHLNVDELSNDAMEHLDVDKLREEFNRASASVRIVSVFSPT